MQRTGTKTKAPAWQQTPAPKQNQSIARSPQLPEGAKHETEGEASRDRDDYGEPEAGVLLDNVAAAIAVAPSVVAQDPTSVPVPQNVQPKLMIGAPGDRYEQEADRVAEQVVQRLQAPASPSMPGQGEGSSHPVQRKSQLTVAGLDLQSKQTASNPDGARPRLQCQRQTGPSEASPDFEAALNLTSGGQPLAPQFRLQAENLMGADFSGVKVHTDGAADQLNQSIQAKAFTNQQDIFFRQGQYNPTSSDGQKLLAHELTHVMQQNSGTVRCKTEDNGAIDLSSVSQSMIQADKEHLQVPAQDKPPAKDAMPNPLPQSNKPITPPLFSDVMDAQEQKQKDAEELQKNGASPALEDKTQIQFNRSRQNALPANAPIPTPPPMMSEEWGLPVEDDEFQNQEEQSNAASLSPEIDANQNVVTLDVIDETTDTTIKESLKSAGKSYTETELSAMGVEKLYYTFEEDKGYVEEAYNEMTPEEIEAAAKENEEQLQHLDEQLKNQADQPQDGEQAKDQPKAESKEEKKKRENEEKHRREHLKVYLEQMKNKEQADSELGKAREHTQTAQQFMMRNYERRSEVGKLYQQIQESREKFAAPSKNAGIKYKNAKQQARKTSEENANKASEICSEALKDEAELKNRKKELQKAKRVAIEMKDNFVKWFFSKLLAKSKVMAADSALGLVSMGGYMAKAEEDKRGFQKPIASTTVKKEAKKAYEQINRERKAIETIQSNAGLEVFDKADKAVYILQLLDKGILTGFKRILTYMKVYASILSSLPGIGFVFGAIGTGLSIVSGAISGVQTILNMIIATIRGLQVWKGDDRLQDLFKMAAIDAGVNGFTASLKTVLFGLDKAGDMKGLDKENPDFNFGNVNIGNVDIGNEPIDNAVEKPINSIIDNAVEKPINSVDDTLNEHLTGSTGVKAAATLSKPLGEEVAKTASKAYKFGNKVKKGELGNADETVRLLFARAANSVLQKTGAFKTQVEPFSANVEQNKVALDEANKEAAENAKKCEDQQQVEQAQEPLAAMNGSSDVMQDADAALKDILAAI